MSADRPLAVPPPARVAPAAGWRERLLQWRTRLLASPAFHRFAAAFPVTRPVARREARALFDLCAGFVYTQVLTAFVELRLPARLAEGGRSVEELLAFTGLPRAGLMRLLVAAESLRLVTLTGPGRERVVLGSRGAALVANPGVLAMIEHHRLLYGDLADPVRLLRGEAGTTRLREYWDYQFDRLKAGADEVAPPAAGELGAHDYTALMAASQQLVADAVLDAYRFGRHRHLLDVGGGSGAFCLAAARRHPELRLTLFDLPPVARRARRRFDEAGLGDRARVAGGSFLDDPLPDGADVVTLVRIVHDHDDAPAARLLASVRRALPQDGALVLAEPMAGTPGAEPMGGAYFGFYLMAMGQGRPRTAAELRRMLREAGFSTVREARTAIPLLTRVLVAKP